MPAVRKLVLKARRAVRTAVARVKPPSGIVDDAKILREIVKEAKRVTAAEGSDLRKKVQTSAQVVPVSDELGISGKNYNNASFRWRLVKGGKTRLQPFLQINSATSVTAIRVDFHPFGKIWLSEPIGRRFQTRVISNAQFSGFQGFFTYNPVTEEIRFYNFGHNRIQGSNK